MKEKIKRKILDYQELFEVMEKNLDKWNGIERFKSSYDEFVRNLKKLEDLKTVAEKKFDEANQKLESLRQDIITRLVPVSNLLDLYALDKNKKSLKKKIDKARGKFDKMSIEQLNKHVAEITDYAENKLNNVIEGKKKENSLEGYGLSMKLINDLKTDNENSIDLHVNLKAEQKAARDAAKEIKKRVKENEKILKNRFKKFMSIFKNTDPAFYEAYENALKKDSSIIKEKKEKDIIKAAEVKKTAPPKKNATTAGTPSKTAVRKNATKQSRKTGTASKTSNFRTNKKPAVKDQDSGGSA